MSEQRRWPDDYDQTGWRWAVTELSIALPEPPPEGETHPERVPVGPFPTREAANAWARAHVRKYGGSGSWGVGPIYPPTLRDDIAEWLHVRADRIGSGEQ